MNIKEIIWMGKNKMSIQELALDICQNRKNVLKLSSKDLRKYKTIFYSQNFKVWQLDLLWEYIFGDITLEEIKNILKLGD